MPAAKSDTHCDVTCPFCGLTCDDLIIDVNQGNLTTGKINCPLALEGLKNASMNPGETTHEASISGEPCNLSDAIKEASTILTQASSPLFSGLATDVNGSRATLNLADRIGAVVDHMNSTAMFRNIHIAQDSGWMGSTLSDIRNHADLLVIFGEKLFDLFPRFLERVAFPESRMYSGQTDREIVLVGPWVEAQLPDALKKAEPWIIPLDTMQLGEFSAILRARLTDKVVECSDRSNLDTTSIKELAAKLTEAHYSAVVWTAGEQDFPHAELVLQNLTEAIKSLNRKTRSTGLSLGGSQGDMTFNQVCTWQTGYPPRTSFAGGQPNYDPMLFDHQRMLSNGEADALLWISCFTPDRPPPESNIPTVVIGHPKMKFARTPEVFLPAGIPGIDHSGHLYRTDAVTTLPLRKLRDSQLPSAATLMDKIAALCND